MTLKLRNYQSEMLRKADAEFQRGHKTVMASLDTGAGKTGIAASWAKRFERKVLFMAPTLAVIGQAPVEFAKWGSSAIAVGSGLRSWESATRRNPWYQPVIACSYRTAFNKLISDGVPDEDAFQDFSAVVVDEAHHAPDGRKQVSQVIDAAKTLGKPVLGITATPRRMSNRESFSPLWDELVIGPQWADLVGAYLADIDLITSRQTIVGAGAYSGQDFKERETMDANRSNPIFTAGAVEFWLKHATKEDGSYPKTIFFTVGQIHAKHVAEAARERGVRTGILVSGQEVLDEVAPGIITDRYEVNRRLRSGELDAITSVNMVTEGYDLPDVECIVCARPTMSVTLWKQICGRGSRLSPGKDRVTIIDLTDNTLRLGDPLRKRRWQLAAGGEDDDPGDAVLRPCTPKGGRREGCGRWLYTGEQSCKPCGEAQGQECDTCGVFRLWKAYERALATCERCVEARDPRPLLEPEGSGWIRVTQLRVRLTRYGVYYIACMLESGADVNYFNARLAKRLKKQFPHLANGKWSRVTLPNADFEVQIVEKTRNGRKHRTVIEARTAPRTVAEQPA